MYTCEYCGTQLAAGDIRCQSCGAPTPPPPPPKPPVHYGAYVWSSGKTGAEAHKETDTALKGIDSTLTKLGCEALRKAVTPLDNQRKQVSYVVAEERYDGTVIPRRRDLENAYRCGPDKSSFLLITRRSTKLGEEVLQINGEDQWAIEAAIAAREATETKK